MFGLAAGLFGVAAWAAAVAGLCGVALGAAAWPAYRLLSDLEMQIIWLKGTLDAVPQPVTVTDMNMKWIFVNKVTEGLLGKDSSQIRGHHCSEWGGGHLQNG
jgi:PAS domain-containing protein